METHVDCISCIVNKANMLVDKYINCSKKKHAFMKKVLQEIIDTDYNKTSPYLTSRVMRILKTEVNVDDIYIKEKKFYNKKLLSMECEIENMLNDSEDKLFDALKLSSAGNIIDFGALDDISFKLVQRIIKKTFNSSFDKHLYNRLKDELKNSKRVVYLGDNAGEIVFDKIFIKYIKKYYPNINIKFATRGAPILNDITEKDAYFVGLDKYTQIINNGTDIPGTDLDEVPNNFKNIINKADLIISKGQGNFESLGGCGKNIYYIFLCKCDMLMKKLDSSRFGNMFISEL